MSSSKHGRKDYHPPRMGLGGWVIVSCLTVLLAVGIRAFVFQTFRIPSASMAPTLLVGDHILVNKLSYRRLPFGPLSRLLSSGRPSRGDVVVFLRFSDFEDLDREKHYIKRVGAVPGDTVEVKGGRVLVNGEVVSVGGSSGNPQLDRELEGLGVKELQYGPIVLGANEFFVLGDNRENSQDSRFFGPVDFGDIEGKAKLIYWSWAQGEKGLEIRWDRIGRRIR